MIYTRFGTQVKIVAHCGEHEFQSLDGEIYTLTLLRIDNVTGGNISHRFAETLRADGGLNAILEEANAAPTIQLTEGELKIALRQAA